MLGGLRELIGSRLEAREDEASRAQAVRLATAALLVEVVRADEAVAGEEAAALYAELGQRFGLRMDESQRLIAAAEREADASVSLHQYTTLLNGALSPAEKLTMLELMWRVALADRVLDKHEEHLVRKVADLLHVPHAEVVRTKLRIQDASG